MRGFATLSVQMPVLAADATRDDYRGTLPEAGERIAAAIAYLRGKGIAKVAIVSHSIGATMVNAYLARPDAAPIVAWAPVGMFGEFAAPPREPVLDVVAERDFPEVLAAAKSRAPKAAARCMLAAGHDRRHRSLRREPAERTGRDDRGVSRSRRRRGLLQPRFQSRSSSSPLAARVNRSRTASHSSPGGTDSMRIASALIVSSARRFA